MAARTPRFERAPLPQFVFSFLSFDLAGLLEDVRRERVPEAPAGIPVGFLEQKPFARIRREGEGWASIDLHPILDRPDVPIEILRFVLMHELLHTVIPAREVRGCINSHPPEFLDEETRRSAPGERALVWEWIQSNFGVYVKNVAGGLHVVARWQASRSLSLRSLDDIRAVVGVHVLTDAAGFCQPPPFEAFDACEAWVEAA